MTSSGVSTASVSSSAATQGTGAASHDSPVRAATAAAVVPGPDRPSGPWRTLGGRWSTAVGRHPAAELVVLAGSALALALVMPYEIAVFGVLVIGVPHVALELRYVCGRYHDRLPLAMFVALQVGLVLIALTRLVAGSSGRLVELGAIVVLSGLSVVVVSRSGVPRPTRAALVVLAAGTVLVAWAITHVDTWFVVQAHLHNLLPLVFLWAWAAVLPDRSRRWTRAACVLFAVVLPLVLLASPLGDAARGPRDLTAAVTPLASVRNAVTPTALAGGDLARRLIVLFAFAQLMHYAIWCWYLPRRAPSATAAFEATPVGRALSGGRFWLLVAGVAVLVAALALVEYQQGRSLYGALGAYHAYLEYPIIAVLALGWLADRQGVTT